MLHPVGIEPRASNFNALHATVWTNPLFAGSIKPLDPYIVMLYWLQKKSLLDVCFVFSGFCKIL